MTALADLAPTETLPVVEPRHPGRATWERPTLIAVLAATALLYLWGLGASGWANSFYSAAVQAGSVSWKAFLFGSFDAANAITVDKPPASLWVMALSVRIFGLSSWSILVPQALMGVGTVAAVWYAVRRWFSAGAALLASIVMALTPVAVLMFRFNNPDALLTLLMALAAITTLRGIEDGRRRWVVATGALVGLGFLTKQLQVMLLVPALAVAWLVAAKGTFRRRLVDLLIAGAAIVAAAGWWVALVQLWPAGSRPWIGGSQTNSVLELTFGYNGLGRITGNEVGSVTGGGGAGAAFGAGRGGGMWGQTGITRMFDGVIGGQIAWLIPAALVALLGGLWVTRRAARTDAQRASLLVWGGWLVVTALTFSFMAGIFHEYYTVALAPAIAVLVGIGVHLLWQHRSSLIARILGSVAVFGSALWSVRLLSRASGWNAWLRPAVLLLAAVAATALLAVWHRSARVAVVAGVVGSLVLLTGPAAWSLQTASTPHSGSIVTAGPDVDNASIGGRFGGIGAFAPGGFPQGALPGGKTSPPPGGTFAGPPNGIGRFTRPGQNGTTGGGTFTRPNGQFGGGPGGLLNGSAPSEALTQLLLQNAADYTWVAAAVGANNASGYQLATEQPVLAIGGFNGSDPFPTLEQFQQMVADGQIHYFISDGGIGAPNGGSRDSSEIATWVSSVFQSTQVGGVTVYDLTATG
jgi:4-amino-4-deoxy-L-arabinose transferase-like glycosyltransferase